MSFTSYFDRESYLKFMDEETDDVFRKSLVNTRPFEFNDENRSRIIERFTLSNTVWLQDLELIDYLYTSLQHCDKQRFKEDNEDLIENIIEMKVTIEILEYFESKGQFSFKPIENSETFEKNKNNVDVCRWILSHCGISENFAKNNPFKDWFSRIIEGSDVEVVSFILKEVANTVVTFDTHCCFLHIDISKDMLKFVILNPQIRNMFMIKISFLDYERLSQNKMENEIITDEDCTRFHGDGIILSILKSGKRKYTDVLDELMNIYGHYNIVDIKSKQR